MAERENLSLIKRHRALIAPSTIDPKLDIVIDHGSGHGIRVKDTEGKEYLTFDSEVAVNALGYKHPKLMEFRQKYPEALDFCEATGRYFAIRNVNLSWIKYEEISLPLLSERLIKKTFPGRLVDDFMIVFKETGALAVNSAIKACLKRNPAKRRMIGFEGAFHGRVEFARALTHSKASQQENYPDPGIHVDHFPYPCCKEDMARIKLMSERIPWGDVGAALGETIQGEGGMQFADPKLFKNLLLSLQKRPEQILVGLDDIQAGSGRTGHWTSWEFLNCVSRDPETFTPDFAILGKALGGGLPIGIAIMPKWELHNGWEGGTFAGLPAAIAHATLFMDIIEEENLINRVRLNGDYLFYLLRELNQKLGLQKDLSPFLIAKGTGFMQGLEFRTRDNLPYGEFRNKILANLLRNGILTSGAGHENINPTIRFTPPYITTAQDIDDMIERLKESITQALRSLHNA